MNEQSLSDRLKDISLGLSTRRYGCVQAIEKLDSLAEELRRAAQPSAARFANCTGAMKALRLRYTTPELIFRELDLEQGVWLYVIGGDGEGAYEWVIEREGKVSEHSDCGYGIGDVAMRDGLLAYYGTPSGMKLVPETQDGIK